MPRNVTTQNVATRKSFFYRLSHDATANTIAIAAASLVPLVAMVGGGVDASRYYMAESRLQAACDAGALAARHALDNDDIADFDKPDTDNNLPSHKQVGLNFFDQNYPDDLFGLTGKSRDYSVSDDGVVTGNASGTLPTTIMGIFGYNDFDLKVKCSADVNISNTDVMFVLDTTGSMGGTIGSTTRIEALRLAVLDFYDTVEGATSSAAQVRYGVVPYSTQVNVGNDLKPAWIASSHRYQTRTSEKEIYYTEETVEATRTGSSYNWNDIGDNRRDFYGISYDECVDLTNYQDDIFVDGNQGSWTLVSSTGTSPKQRTYTGPVKFMSRSYISGSGWYSGSNQRCSLKFEERTYWAQATITTIEKPNERWTYVYDENEVDLSSLFPSKRVNFPTGYQGGSVSHAWNGCIEEARTVDSSAWDPTTSTTVPSTAYDLDIDLVPDTDEKRWKPMLPSLVYARYTDEGSFSTSNTGTWVKGSYKSTKNKNRPLNYCPKAARKLAEIDDRQDLYNYLYGSSTTGEPPLTPSGYTYHDFGMLWGARYINPDGIFASENATTKNGNSIARHIIFMTDGDPQPNLRVYGLYGMEWWDRRITTNPTFAQMKARHEARLQVVCKAARRKNISVWVVAFGTSLTKNLTDCATPGRAFHADNPTELRDTFKEIAEKIAALRLTQ